VLGVDGTGLLLLLLCCPLALILSRVALYGSVKQDDDLAQLGYQCIKAVGESVERPEDAVESR
jgi:hypothetical protein